MLNTRTKFLKEELDKNPSQFKSSKVKLDAIKPKLKKDEETTDFHVLVKFKEPRLIGEPKDAKPSAQLLKPELFNIPSATESKVILETCGELTAGMMSGALQTPILGASLNEDDFQLQAQDSMFISNARITTKPQETSLSNLRDSSLTSQAA